MNILYIGQIGYGQTCRDRMLALADLGHSVASFDTTPYLDAGPRWQRSLAHRFNVGARLAKLNRDLLAWAGNVGRADLVWVDKGKWVFPESVVGLRKVTNAIAVHYTPDSQFLSNRSRYFTAALPHFDVAITTKPFELPAYRRSGRPRVVLTGQSYDEIRAKGGAFRPEYESDVSFIGHAEPWYRRTLLSVAKDPDVLLRVWGPGWVKPRHARGLATVGPGLYGADYISGMKSSRIGLGLLQKTIPETSTTRSFEIPACGTFLLAERTGEHQRFFEEGLEADYFSTGDELMDKVRFYLRHDDVRKRIAAAGRRRCTQSGYGNRARLRRILAWIADSDEPFCDQRFGNGQAVAAKAASA